ncbi:MAG TPA: transposase [Candidatus Limnocylindria bacterium]|nr:transposase [Candidatus Limnocylindria bacterium]
MPGRNIVKQYAADQYYHIYSRGVAKQAVYLDEQDYMYFLGLLKRYLSNEPSLSTARVAYPCYGKRAKLLTYCLMSNHFHLLLFQSDEKAIVELMRSLMTSYSMYFNRRYKRVGPVFQSRYKASRISEDSYLEHISRYIHLNPKEWETYEYSSLRYYLGNAQADWVKPDQILDIFPSQEQYLEFVRDYEGHKAILDEIHWELADQ